MFAKPSSISLRQHLGALLASVLCLSTPALAETNLYLGGGGTYKLKPGITLNDRRFNNVVRQMYDYSCGSAALATLLTYHYAHPVKEMDVLQAMYVRGDQEKIQREGFSLLDMKQYLNAIGYNAEGYKESLDKLADVGVPAIVLLNKRGFLHFVVVKGVNKDKVSVGDSKLGMTIYQRKEFEKMWNGILFVITDNMHMGRMAFNSVSAWHPYGVADYRAMIESGDTSTMALSNVYTPNVFY